MADGDVIDKAVEKAQDSKVTESRPVQVQQVAVMAIGDMSKVPSGTVATTEGLHVPNFVFQAVNPLLGLVVRFVNLFLLTLVGLLSVKMAPASANTAVAALQAADFYTIVMAGCSVSLATASWGLIKDLSTIFTGLAKKYPLATGNV